MKEHFLFYVPPDEIVDNQVQFPEEEANHIVKVLRKRPGDLIQVTDGVGNTMDVRLSKVDKRQVTGEVIANYITPDEPDRILAIGVIRQRDRLEFAVEKAVELGVTRIIFVHSDHAGKIDIKARRIDKSIISAIKQSRRSWLPAWEERESFYDVLAEYKEGRKVIMAHPDEEGTHEWKPDDSPMLLLIGPEGGFSEKEVKHALIYGAKVVSLGQKRLRTETAACALLVLANLR